MTSTSRWRGSTNTGSGLPDPKGPAASSLWASSGRRGGGRHRRVDLEARVGAGARDRLGEPLLEEGAPFAQPRLSMRHARRHRVAAALDEQPRLDRGAHRLAEIDAGDRAAGPDRMSAGEGQREGRAVEPLLEPRGENADDARRPVLARHHHRRAPLVEAERGQRLGLGLRQRGDLDLLAGAVQPVELGGDGARLEVVRRRQEPRAEARVADPAARVDPRADQEAEMIGPRRPVRAGDVEQGREARPAALPHHLEPLDDEGAVEAGQRHDVGDGRERHEVERATRSGALRPFQKPFCAQGPVQRDQRHEHDARGGEMAEAREVVLPGSDRRARAPSAASRAPGDGRTR